MVSAFGRSALRNSTGKKVVSRDFGVPSWLDLDARSFCQSGFALDCRRFRQLRFCNFPGRFSERLQNTNDFDVLRIIGLFYAIHSQLGGKTCNCLVPISYSHLGGKTWSRLVARFAPDLSFSLKHVCKLLKADGFHIIRDGAVAGRCLVPTTGFT